VAVRNREIIGRPLTDEARPRRPALVRGRALTFYDGVCVLDSQTDYARRQVIPYRVQFRELSALQTQTYSLRETPYECAGSFNHKRLGISLFETITTDDPAVLTALPVFALVTLLSSPGLDALNVQSRI
jgi:septum formation protein